jgi:hypothetical protein
MIDQSAGRNVMENKKEVIVPPKLLVLDGIGMVLPGLHHCRDCHGAAGLNAYCWQNQKTKP